MNLHYFIHVFLLYSAKLLAIYFIVSNLSALILILLAWHSTLKRKKQASDNLEIKEWVSVSILVPAHNEEATIAQSVRALLDLKYPHYEVIVIDDGSRDRTLEELSTTYQLYPSNLKRYSELSLKAPIQTFESRIDPRLKVLVCKNGGKAAALNLGTDYANGVLIATMDADTLVERDAITQAVYPFYEYPKTLVGVGGTLRISNGAVRADEQAVRGNLPPISLPLFQILEYIRAFYLGRIGWDSLDATTLLSGAFAVFRKTAVIEVGGFDPASITEDLEITLRLRKRYPASRNGPRFKMVHQPIAWTQVPESYAELGKQRIRWQRGLVQSIRKHWGLVFSPPQKWVGWGAMPYMVLFEVMGPLFELLGYAVVTLGILHGAIEVKTAIYFLLAGLSYAMLIGVMTIHLEEKYFSHHPSFKRDWKKFLLGTVLDCLYYRQVVWAFRLRAMIESLYKKAEWGSHQRQSFAVMESEVDVKKSKDKTAA